MKIPTQFTLINRKFIVEEMHSDTYDVAEAKGAVSIHAGRILLYTGETDNPIDLEQTFCHELVHAWLEMSGFTELSKNEDSVDLLANVLHQFFLTVQGDFRKKIEAEL